MVASSFFSGYGAVRLAHLLWEQGVEGSNPFAPTNNNQGVTSFRDSFFHLIERIMVKHIILWTLNPELSEDEKNAVKAGIKEGLEGLVGKVPGLIDVKVTVDGRLASSTADLMLDCSLENAEALKVYASHPDHLAVANTKVRPYTVQRACLDFEL